MNIMNFLSLFVLIPLLMLLGRRGQIMHIDPFDNKKGNFNVAVAAGSGNG